MNMGVMVMTVRAHDAGNAVYRMIGLRLDGTSPGKESRPATCHDEWLAAGTFPLAREYGGRVPPAAVGMTLRPIAPSCPGPA